MFVHLCRFLCISDGIFNMTALLMDMFACQFDVISRACYQMNVKDWCLLLSGTSVVGV